MATYFFSRKFIPCGQVVRYIDLAVVVCEDLLVVQSALKPALSTADADLFMKKHNNHMDAPSSIPLASQARLIFFGTQESRSGRMGQRYDVSSGLS